MVVVLGAIAAGHTTAAEVSRGSIGLLAVDMDITGNTIGSATDRDGDGTADTEATSLGSVEDCAQVASGGTIQVDIVVRGYPTANPLVGYDITLNYDPAVANVTGTAFETFTGALGPSIPELRTLISADPQSGPIFEVDEDGESISLPDTDGQFAIAVLDLAPGPDPDEDLDGEEVSDGFLARIQLTAVGAGQTTLSLTTTSEFVLDDEGPVDIDALNFGFLSVDEACVPGEQPPPPVSSADGSLSTPGTQTPLPGTPGTATQADGPPGSGVSTQTPGPGTPALSGTPLSGDAGGTGREAPGPGGDAPGAGETDGGLSTGAWAGIGIGIAAAALAASGAGWFALRRRRANGKPTPGGEAGSA